MRCKDWYWYWPQLCRVSANSYLAAKTYVERISSVNLQIFFQTIVNGLFTGGIYALVAIGLTLIYGVMLILNFAHGEFLMLGMYISYWLFTLAGLDPYLSVPIAALLIFGLGALIQRGLVQRVLAAHPLNQIILLLGVSTLI